MSRNGFIMPRDTVDVQPSQPALTPESLEGIIESVIATAAERIYQAQGQGGLSVSRAWIFQDDKQVKKHGAEKASYYVGWIDPAGTRRCKSCGAGADGKRNAAKLRRKVEAELLTGTYAEKVDCDWKKFLTEYEETVIAGKSPRTQVVIRTALDHFTRLVKPKRLTEIRTAHIDRYKAARRKERRFESGPTTSPATINKELKMVRTALLCAKRWGYLAVLPEMTRERVPEKLPEYITPEHFAELYAVCDQARLPRAQAPYTMADWWRGLLTMAFMTGWRVSELLGFQRDDLNLDAGTATTRADANKGRRDALIWLHPVVVDHLRKLTGFTPEVFPWPHNRKTLDKELHRLCRLAAVPEYGFHDFRRAFATMNADRVSAEALQILMRHRDYKTTRSYINTARQLNPAAQSLFVPEVLRGRGTGTEG